MLKQPRATPRVTPEVRKTPTPLMDDLADSSAARASNLTEEDKRVARRILSFFRIELCGILMVWAGVNPKEVPIAAKRYAEDMDKVNPL